MKQIFSWVRSNKVKAAISGFSIIGLAWLVLLMFLGNGHLNLSFEDMKKRLVTSESISEEFTVQTSTPGTGVVPYFTTYHSEENIQANDSDSMSLVSTEFVNPELLDDQYLCEKQQQVMDLLNSNSVASATSFITFPTEADHIGENYSNNLHEQIIKFDNSESPNRIVELLKDAVRRPCTDNPERYKFLGTSSKVYKMGPDDSFVYEFSGGSYFKRTIVVLADGPFLVTLTGFDSFVYKSLDPWENNEVDWASIVKTAIVKLYDK